MKTRRLIIVVIIVLICLLSYFVNLEFEAMLGPKIGQVLTGSTRTLTSTSRVGTPYVTQTPGAYPEPLIIPTKTIPRPTVIAPAYPPPAPIFPSSAQPYPSPVSQFLSNLGIVIGILIGIVLGLMVHALTTFIRMEHPAGLAVGGLLGLGMILYLYNAAPNFMLTFQSLLLLALPLGLLAIVALIQILMIRFPWWVAALSQSGNFFWMTLLFLIYSKNSTATVHSITYALLLTVVMLELVSPRDIFFRSPSN